MPVIPWDSMFPVQGGKNYTNRISVHYIFPEGKWSHLRLLSWELINATTPKNLYSINYMNPLLYSICLGVVIPILAGNSDPTKDPDSGPKSQLPMSPGLDKEQYGRKAAGKKPSPIGLQGLSFLFFIAIYFPPGFRCQYIGRPSRRWRQWNLARTLNTGSSCVWGSCGNMIDKCFQFRERGPYLCYRNSSNMLTLTLFAVEKTSTEDQWKGKILFSKWHS